jgi:hypothetical protein
MNPLESLAQLFDDGGGWEQVAKEIGGQYHRGGPCVCLAREEERPPGIETLFGGSNVELYTIPYGQDVAKLKTTFEMFGEALRQLRRIGSA